jgi:hypothetical protein
LRGTGRLIHTKGTDGPWVFHCAGPQGTARFRKTSGGGQ